MIYFIVAGDSVYISTPILEKSEFYPTSSLGMEKGVLEIIKYLVGLVLVTIIMVFNSHCLKLENLTALNTDCGLLVVHVVP